MSWCICCRKRNGNDSRVHTMEDRADHQSPSVASRKWASVWTVGNLHALLVANGVLWWCLPGTVHALLGTLITAVVIITALSVELNIRQKMRAHVVHVSRGTTVTPDMIEHTLQHAANGSEALLTAYERAMFVWLAQPTTLRKATASSHLYVSVMTWRMPMAQLSDKDVLMLLADTDRATRAETTRLRSVLQHQFRKFEVSFNRRIAAPSEHRRNVATVRDAMDIFAPHCTPSRTLKIACMIGLNGGSDAFLLCMHAKQRRYMLLRVSFGRPHDDSSR